MRIVLELDGKPTEVEVDLDLGTVRLGEATHPFKIVGQTADRIELEIAGEPAAVDDWSEGALRPGRRFSVNGETIRAVVTSRTETGRSSPPSSAPASAPVPASSAARPSAASSDTGPGVAIRPPMPGKVLEVRVTEGQVVAAGDILLVLEAMKMRNELTAPVAGRVQGVAARAGETARASDVLLRILPI
ncbi:MAG: biotin/lipoyl-binding protein [Thermoplasmata archaeon]|nr:biotin/lipoyl-binding protein [Thermoplasmata archaeon]